MTDETTPTTETVATAAQVAANTETMSEAVQQEEAFDKERAMSTIHKQREEAKALKAQLKELETLKAEKAKREEAEMTESQRLQKQAEELAAQNAKLTADIWRRDVVAETGIPAVFADRIKGSTKEEMLADALELAKQLPQAKVTPKVNTTNPSNGNTQMTDDERRAFLGFRR